MSGIILTDSDDLPLESDAISEADSYHSLDCHTLRYPCIKSHEDYLAYYKYPIRTDPKELQHRGITATYVLPEFYENVKYVAFVEIKRLMQ